MERCPTFHKYSKKIEQIDFMKNVWCPLYEECLDEAAAVDCLMDCSKCKNAIIDFRKGWSNQYLSECMSISKV